MGTIDEAPGLGVLLPTLRPIVREIVVVDDGSRDGSPAIARAAGALVMARPRRLGIGSAVYAGVAAAAEPAIATLDADMSHPPQALVAAHEWLLAGYDVVRFSRFLPAAEWRTDPARRLALALFGRVLAAACRLRLTDPTNGFMLARRDCFAGPTRFTTDAGEGWVAEFLARNRGRRMIELPYVHGPRHGGRSHFTLGQELSRAVRSFRFGIAAPPAGRHARPATPRVAEPPLS
jgi:glycosyltransferase involved in cell wall biosynthesis